MTWLLSLAILLMGLGDLVAIWLDRRSWRYLFKPGTIFLIIALAATALPDAGPIGYWVLLGLLFSVAGDILLVLPSDRFLAGLISFFIAHICYVVAFAFASSGLDLAAGLVALSLLAVGLLLFRRTRPGVIRDGGRQMLLPVGLYVLIISLMVLTAYTTGNPWLVAGALFFLVSDTILAWDRFIEPLRKANIGIMVTYFGAQYLIALSLLVG